MIKNSSRHGASLKAPFLLFHLIFHLNLKLTGIWKSFFFLPFSKVSVSVRIYELSWLVHLFNWVTFYRGNIKTMLWNLKFMFKILIKIMVSTILKFLKYCKYFLSVRNLHFGHMCVLLFHSKIFYENVNFFLWSLIKKIIYLYSCSFEFKTKCRFFGHRNIETLND